jgi:superfamily II DNA/RNA helicase
MTDEYSFDKLKLSPDLLKGVYLYGFNKPSKIQVEGIELIKSGADCILQSQSGTGKTATYLLGSMEKNSIILTPTRELALQVYDVATTLSKYMPEIKIELCIGGTDLFKNKQGLKAATILLGTLGRMHHITIDTKMNLKNVKCIILDEADNIMYNEINSKLIDIIEKLPTNCQAILISATLNRNVTEFSKKYMHNPKKILLKNEEIVVDLISQFYLKVNDESQKFETLLDIYSMISACQAIIFCNSINKVKWLEIELTKANFTITTLHSQMSQQERNTTMQDFREGTTRILLTTDLLSRGIDIPAVNMVINYDLPSDKETYIHRIGRCGRFGCKGVAINILINDDLSDMKILARLKQFYKLKITQMPDDISSFM